MPDHRHIPPDQDQRDIILHDLDTTLLVEAAAGTGKTTGMVGRMVNMLANGTCAVDTLAAVTFTGRLQLNYGRGSRSELEKACRSADRGSARRLSAALDGMERCFIGTIHSFCARMLRERPVEAGVDLDFEEVDEVEDSVLRNQAWATYLKRLYAFAGSHTGRTGGPGCGDRAVGPYLRKDGRLSGCGAVACTCSPGTGCVRGTVELAELVRHMERVATGLPEATGTDPLMPKYRIIPRMFRQVRRKNRTSRLWRFCPSSGPCVLSRSTGLRVPEQADTELGRMGMEFRTRYAEPLVIAWREYRYEPLLRAILPALEVYDELRRDLGKLNYQDLLIKTARLLRDTAASRVRDYFRRRFTHILVDEFQDTDPVQAEVIMLLTAENAQETNWRNCKPVSGSLFVVGDPKQSIYRFVEQIS